MDYGWRGLALIVPLYLFSGNKKIQALVTAAWAIVAYLGIGLGIGKYLLYVGGNCAAAACILLYSGEQGKKSRIFYYVYPVHLAIYGLIAQFIL